MARPSFPRTLAEFQRCFSDEATCRAYLVASRWTEGFRCPRCAHPEGFDLRRRGLWQCKACGHQTSVTAGTIMHRTHVPLTGWFWAAYLMATHTPGMSALQLKRQLGLGSYRTAWLMLHKLRRAMVRPERELLHGEVEVDETYVGGPEAGLRGGREKGEKALVVGAVEVRGEGSGRVRLRSIPDASARSLTGFIRANVELGTTVRTDGWGGYASLDALGYRHRPRVQGERERAKRILPRIHRVFGNLQTWLRGTHHGVDKQNLQLYLDEYTYRFNRRRVPMAAFQTLLGLGSQHKPLTRNQLRIRS